MRMPPALAAATTTADPARPVPRTRAAKSASLRRLEVTHGHADRTRDSIPQADRTVSEGRPSQLPPIV
jgi:hypothetical protein